MSRYTALSLIPLPRVSATAAVALGAHVLSAAEGLKKEKRFPKELQTPLTTLADKHAALSTTVSGSVLSAEAQRGVPISTLDVALDNCWGGLDDRLLGMSRLPDEPKARDAAALRTRLFPDGLKFLTYEYKVEWAESKARLDAIDKESLGPEVDRLAGKEFLPAVRKAHAAYGEALGLTGAVASPVTEQAVLRTARDELLLALRRYVTKVVAFGDDDSAEGEAVMKALLWPIDEWLAAQAKRNGKDTTPTADTSANGATAGPEAPPGAEAEAPVLTSADVGSKVAPKSSARRNGR